MKLSISYFLSYLFILTPLYAGTQTLTTYYPAPNGNYNKISTNSMRFGASTLSAVQAQYKCSYDPADGLPACPAGIVFYNTGVNPPAIYISDGNNWRSMAASCVPNSPCVNHQDDCGYC